MNAGESAAGQSTALVRLYNELLGRVGGAILIGVLAGALFMDRHNDKAYGEAVAAMKAQIIALQAQVRDLKTEIERCRLSGGRVSLSPLPPALAPPGADELTPERLAEHAGRASSAGPSGDLAIPTPTMRPR